MDSKRNAIGLPEAYTKEIDNALNKLLASASVYYQNLRGLHWNISGRQFFQLHEKFELLYTQAALDVDEIAERILSLTGQPLHTLEDFIQNYEISSARGVFKDTEAVAVILDNLSRLLKIERNILAQAAEANDDGTADLMTRLINAQEKDHWMMNAWLS